MILLLLLLLLLMITIIINKHDNDTNDTTTTTTNNDTTNTNTNTNNDKYYGRHSERGEDTVGDPRRGRTSPSELFELKLFNSSLSSNFSIRAFRAYPLVEIGQTVPCRAIRGNNISVNSTLPPSYRHRILSMNSEHRTVGHGKGDRTSPLCTLSLYCMLVLHRYY